MLRNGVLVVVSGPSGVGKTTLCKNIVTRLPATAFSVSYTTRKPRPGEREGVEYFFVDDARFQDLVREEAFIEWAEVYGHKYGTPKHALLESLHKGINVLLEIDAQGAKQIMERFAGAVYVFVAPRRSTFCESGSVDGLKIRWRTRRKSSVACMKRVMKSPISKPIIISCGTTNSSRRQKSWNPLFWPNG